MTELIYPAVQANCIYEVCTTFDSVRRIYIHHPVECLSPWNFPRSPRHCSWYDCCRRPRRLRVSHFLYNSRRAGTTLRTARRNVPMCLGPIKSPVNLVTFAATSPTDALAKETIKSASSSRSTDSSPTSKSSPHGVSLVRCQNPLTKA